MKRCRAAPLAVAGLLLSCGPSEAPPPPRLEVEYSGCSSVHLPGPVCARWADPKVKVKLWVKTDPGGRIEIRADDRLLETGGEEVGSGWRYGLFIPEKARLLTVSVVLRDGGRNAIWSLRLAGPDIPGGQSFVLRQLALQAQVKGDHEKEETYLLRGLAVDRTGKLFSGEVEKTTWLVNLYLNAGRFGEARQILENLQLPLHAPADTKYLKSYYQGLLSDAVGDYRSALDQLGDAASLAERVGMAKFLWDAEQIRARILQDVGRSREASVLFERLKADPHPSNPCDLGSLLTNAGWARLKAREAGEDPGDAADPTPILEEARAQFDLHQCPPDKRLNARFNLALAHQQAGRWSEARRALRQAQALAVAPNLLLRLWWDDLEGRMAISEGHSERALRIYEQLGKTAALAQSLEGDLRAQLGTANARLALGRRTEAIAALAEADRSIDRQSWLIPAHEGRDTFIAQREAVTRLYLKLLLDEGRREDAFSLARRARSRLLRQLTVNDRLARLKPAEQRRWSAALLTYRTLRDAIDRQAAEEWQLAGDQVERAHAEQMERLATARNDLERALSALGDPGSRAAAALSPPRPSEVILAYHPLGNKRWVRFAATDQGVETSTFDLPDEALAAPSRLARLLLEPFSSAIRSAGRVRVLPYGPLRFVDFHALPFDGEPLLAKHVVVYSLDLPARSTLAPSGRPAALIVSNPSDDLPATQDEAEAVSKAVCSSASGWSCERLDGEEASAEAVRKKLSEPSLFHYAGHGIFAGFSGWGSALPLAGDSRLTVGDVLALRPVPDWVVLSACDAARSSEEAPGEGIGIANAFLVAGSHGVIAARSPVLDSSARDLMRELYRGWQPGQDLAGQLQKAQIAARQKDSSPGGAWALFRILVP